MKTEPLLTNAGLGSINLSTLNPKYIALDSIRTDNAHVKEFLHNFQSEFWISHKMRIHHSVKVTKEHLIRDRVLIFIYKKISCNICKLQYNYLWFKKIMVKLIITF
jgi:hypothetical protein